jgi:HD-GYP domain-containing protein (c-di-GMP phosphodiesterase class II)
MPRRISLIVFVITALLVVGLLPIVLTGYFLSDKSGAELRASENRYQIQLVQDKASQIELFGRRFTSVVSGLAMALELSRDASATAQTEARLAALLKENHDLIALSVRPVGSEPYSVFRAEAIDSPAVEPIVLEALETKRQGRVSVSRPANASESVMTFATDVVVDGVPAASIVAVASLDTISKNVVGITAAKEAELWRLGLPMVFVVDSQGRALFHPDRELTRAGKPMVDLKIVQDWLQSGNQVKSALVPFTANYAGTDHEMIGAYSTANVADGYSFGVVSMQAESTALALVGEMRNQVWVISLVIAVFALAAGLYGARFMTSPLRKLVDAAELVASGDFSTRVTATNITEINTLGDTFNLMSDKVEEQIANLANAAKENRELFEGTVKALAAAIDGKDKYTRGHSERVARISVAIGRRLGMDDAELETLRMSALLHDIGKIAIDDAILKKPAALTDAEYEIMKTHPQRGYKIMSQIPAMKDFLPGMYMHHEMVNGKGYPQGLMGDQIPMQAKIVSVADTFDAMTIDRPYSKGMELHAALTRLREFVGTRYQAEVVEALVEACEAGEVANGIVRQMAAIRAAEAEHEAAPALVA